MANNKLTDNLANNSPISSNSLSDTEIKKALECCKNDDCDNCPNDFGNCYSNLAGYALDLINRQEEEKQNLKAEKENLVIDLTNAMAKIAGLEKQTEWFTNIGKLYSEIKAEAYKEFATKATDKVEKVKQKYERLCKEQGEKMEEHMHIHFNGIIKIVKDLLNELVGDGDGK